MFVAKAHQRHQAPLGAAYPVRSMVWNDMPLLMELENDSMGPRRYKHDAPDGAMPSAQGYEVSGLKVGVRIPRGGRSRIGPLNPIIRALGSLAPAEGERAGVRGLPGELGFMGRGNAAYPNPTLAEGSAAVEPSASIGESLHFSPRL
jgi:hypothetical protein